MEETIEIIREQLQVTKEKYTSGQISSEDALGRLRVLYVFARKLNLGDLKDQILDAKVSIEEFEENTVAYMRAGLF